MCVSCCFVSRYMDRIKPLTLGRPPEAPPFPVNVICDPVPGLVSQNLKCLWDHEVIGYKCYSRFALLRSSEMKYHYFCRDGRHLCSYLGDLFRKCRTFDCFVTVGEMGEVFTGSGCDFFVPVDLSVSAKSLSKSWNRWCDVFPFDSNIKSDCCKCSLVHSYLRYSMKLKVIFYLSCLLLLCLAAPLGGAKAFIHPEVQWADAKFCCEIWRHLAVEKTS